MTIHLSNLGTPGSMTALTLLFSCAIITAVLVFQYFVRESIKPLSYQIQGLIF